MSHIRNNGSDDNIKKNNDDGSIRIKRSTFNKIALGAVATLAVATFFGGYILGGLNAGVGSINTPAGTQQRGVIPTAPTQQAPAPSLQKIQSVSLDGALTLGKQDAQVAVVEFADFQCPFCKRHFDDSFTQIKQEYVDSG